MSKREAGIVDAYADDDVDDDYIKVLDAEGSDPMEFPKEDNGTVMLSTIQAQFPHAIGLKFQSSSGAWRGVGVVDNVLNAPRGGWGERTYYVTASQSHKRKRTDSVHGDEETSKDITSVVDPLLQDIAVLNLAYSTTEEEFTEYFETNCGELTFSALKVEHSTGKSRGFGFIRFKCIEAAKEAVNGNHYLQGRKLDVRPKKVNPIKLFVGRLPRGTTREEIVSYFSKFGELTDTYVPQPFKGFAFITFASSEVGHSVLRQTHVLGGICINVEERKGDTQRNQQQRDVGDRSNSSYGEGRSNSSYGDGRSNSSYGEGRSKSLYGGGDATQYNPSNTQHDTHEMASELKNMLVKFLQHEK